MLTTFMIRSLKSILDLLLEYFLIKFSEILIDDN